MSGVGQKIKNALTPGHHKRENEGTYTETNTAGADTYNRGTPGMGGDLVTNSIATTSSSDSEMGAVPVGTRVEGVAVATTVTAPAGGDTVCDTRTFTEVEDRPIMRERVERIIEHRPVEKQFVVETRPVGEREVAEGVHFESAGVREYEVDRVEGTKCPTTGGAGAVGNRNVL